MKFVTETVGAIPANTNYKEGNPFIFQKFITDLV